MMLAPSRFRLAALVIFAIVDNNANSDKQQDDAAITDTTTTTTTPNYDHYYHYYHYYNYYQLLLPIGPMSSLF